MFVLGFALEQGISWQVKLIEAYTGAEDVNIHLAVRAGGLVVRTKRLKNEILNTMIYYFFLYLFQILISSWHW